MSVWNLVYDRFEPEQERQREALCTLGNGYLFTRGAAPESSSDDIHYPGTYIAGLYNRLTSEVDGRRIEHESLVNLPNWLSLSFRIGDGDWFDRQRVTILEYRQELDFRQGVLRRSVCVEDGAGRRTKLDERRFVSQHDPHLAGLETTITAENWSDAVELRSAIDGRVSNSLVESYQELSHHHLEPLEAAEVDDETIWLKMRTNQSRIEIDMAVRTRILTDGKPLSPERRTLIEAGYAAHQASVDVREGVPLTVEKIAAVYTSRDHAISESGLAARRAVTVAADFESLLGRHVVAWEHLWDRCRLDVEDDDVLRILRFHQFHILQTASPNVFDLDVGVPARGWTGEAYRGHIFWDELFVLPYLNLHLPDVSRSLLLYRWRRLDEARRRARQAGFRGAMFPWQSGSSGREETTPVYPNPRTGGWIPDYTERQRHINAAIAYNFWQHYEVTGDADFLSGHAAEMICEIARFWASIATYNDQLDRFEIHGVIGPDEFHSAYPWSDEPGLSNNTYTNVVAVWCLCRALDALDRLPDWRRTELCESIELDPDEVARWERISRRMRVVFLDNGIPAQFEGYDQLEELDWEAYRRKYGDIQRMDHILDAEGDTPNRYKLAKQPDVLMLLYLFSTEELRTLFSRLGYSLDLATIRRTVDYYLARSTHGSTLSRVVHAWITARFDGDQARHWFREALKSDVSDIQGGTTAEGIHLGAMAGTVGIVERRYLGLDPRGDVLRFDPLLPDETRTVSTRVIYRRCWLDVTVMHDRLRVGTQADAHEAIVVGVGDVVKRLEPGATSEWPLRNDGQGASPQRAMVVVVTGFSAAAKSPIARRIAADLGIPLLARDAMKERLFDTVGWEDPGLTDRIDSASYELLYQQMEVLGSRGVSFVVESDFDPERGRESLLDLQQRLGLAYIQVNCRADHDELLRRFEERVERGDRHPGHHDDQKLDDFRRSLDESRDEVLDLNAPLIAVDTTDPAVVQNPDLTIEIREAFERLRSEENTISTR